MARSNIIIDKSNFFEDFSSCFTNYRDQRFLEHSVKDLVGQRTVGICLGYEDINDHDELRRDPLLGTVCEKLDPTGKHISHEWDRGKALAGESTLNRLETFLVRTDANLEYKDRLQ